MRQSTLIFFSICVWLLASAGFHNRVLAQEDSKAPTSKLNKKTIRSIEIVINDIFEDPDNAIYRTANQLKINTKKEIVKRELLFAEGGAYDRFLIEESERVLRAQKYLRNVNITTKEDGNFVDVVVSVQDTWTFIPQLGYSNGDGRKRVSAGLSENDLMGLGKRVEALYEDDDSRNSLEGVYEDPRLLGSDYRAVGAIFHRSDGDRGIFILDKPFRSLLDKEGWALNGDLGNTVGRLFRNGDERFIFRQERVDLSFRYTTAAGDPETSLRRYSLGWDYHEAIFEDADLSDYDDVNVDPDSVDHAPNLLAEDRRYNGPSLNYQHIEQDFVSMNYIDRFERVEDYNLGDDFSANIQVAPELLGSKEDALLFSANRSHGIRFTAASFMRGELGLATRRTTSDFEDSLLRGELKYYNVLGSLRLSNLYLGRHTLAYSMFVDYANDLDKDREFLIGGDNAIRGYKARTFTGDKRYALNMEDRIHLVDDAFDLVSLGAAFFVDVGGATTRPLGALFSDETYSDVGFGLRFAFPRSSGERVLRVDIALPLRDGPDGSGAYEPRFLISGGQLFGSKLRSESLGPEKASVEVGFDR